MDDESKEDTRITWRATKRQRDFINQIKEITGLTMSDVLDEAFNQYIEPRYSELVDGQSQEV